MVTGMSIQKEAWFSVVSSPASLDKELRRLIQEAKRGHIPAGEFMRKVVRLFDNPSDYEEEVEEKWPLLDNSNPAQPKLSQAWVKKHRDLLDRANVLFNDDRILAFSRLDWGVDYLEFLRAKAEKGIFPELVYPERQVNTGLPFESEAEFNQWSYSVVEEGEKFLESLGK